MIPNGYDWTNVTVQCWSGGGGGGSAGPGGSGGGGGAYAYNTYPTLLSGSYNYYIGAGGGGGSDGSGSSGGSTIWNYGGAQDIYVSGGGGGYQNMPITGSPGLVVAGTGFQGGGGGAYGYDAGGGGGGSAGPSGAGGDGSAPALSYYGAPGGTGYGPGGVGGGYLTGGAGAGSFPGGGGGGGGYNGPGGSGANGEIIITYTPESVLGTLSLSTNAVTLRAMRNSGTMTSVTLSETSGLNSPGFSSSLSGAATISPASGIVAVSGTQSLNLGWNSYASTGPLTGTVTLSNTTNSADPFNSAGNVINMTGAVVDNRVVTSTSASFGLVHVGAAISQSITLSTTGDDSYYTRVMVTNGGTDNNGFLTVSGGSNPTFNGPSVTDNRTISGTANTSGVFNGTVTLTTIGEGLPSESPISVPVNYSVQVFSGQSGWAGGSSGSWGNAANWQDQVTPSISAVPGIWGVSGDTATLGSGPNGPVTITLDGTSPHLGSLTFSSTDGYTLTSGSGGTLNMDNGASAASVTVAAGSHVIAAPVVLNSNTNVAVNNAGDTLTVSGPVSGSGGLTTSGGGVVVLSAANTYSGGTTVNAGTLVVANSSGSAVGSGGILISGGTLQVGNGGTAGTLPAGVTNNSVLAFDRSDAITLGGLICGSGSLVQAGPGTLNLTGTVSNSTIVGNAGQVVLTPSLVFSGDLATAPGGRIQNNSSLQFGNLTNGGIFAGGGSLLGNFVNQPTGSVRLTAGQSFFLQSTSPQSNAGLISVIGTQAAQASFESAGPFTNAPAGTALIAAQNATITLDSGLTNEAAIAFSNGVNNVFGTVANTPSGNITVTGGASTTFYGDVAQNGTLVVSKVGNIESSAVFLGAFTGGGGFTGGGDVFIEGNLRPSDPVEEVFGGNVYFGSSTNTVMQLAGTTAGSGFDQITCTGQLVLAGSLDIELINGFMPQAGESFQLFNGSLSGAFDEVTLPTLDNGLTWNTSNVNTNGTITVTPEPSSFALLTAAGIVGLASYVWSRRRAARRTANPVAFDQQDTPAILSFPSRSPVSAARRAA